MSSQDGKGRKQGSLHQKEYLSRSEVRAAVAESIGLKTVNTAIDDFRAVVPSALVRKGLWLPRIERVELPYRGLDVMASEDTVRRGKESFSVAGSPLSVFDLDVCTWLCTRWYRGGQYDLVSPSKTDVPIETTMYEMCHEFFGNAGGKNRKLLYESLRRLHESHLVFEHWDKGLDDYSWTEMFNLLPRIRADVMDSGVSLDLTGPRDMKSDAWSKLSVGGNATLRIWLNSWVRDQLSSRSYTSLDWQMARSLDQVAKKLYYRLESDRFKLLDGNEGLYVNEYRLHPRFFIEHGLRYKRDRDCRRVLGSAYERLRKTDARYRVAALVKKGRGHKSSYWLQVIRKR